MAAGVYLPRIWSGIATPFRFAPCFVLFCFAQKRTNERAPESHYSMLSGGSLIELQYYCKLESGSLSSCTGWQWLGENV